MVRIQSAACAITRRTYCFTYHVWSVLTRCLCQRKAKHSPIPRSWKSECTTTCGSKRFSEIHRTSWSFWRFVGRCAFASWKSASRSSSRNCSRSLVNRKSASTLARTTRTNLTVFSPMAQSKWQGIHLTNLITNSSWARLRANERFCRAECMTSTRIWRT